MARLHRLLPLSGWTPVANKALPLGLSELGDPAHVVEDRPVIGDCVEALEVGDHLGVKQLSALSRVALHSPSSLPESKELTIMHKP